MATWSEFQTAEPDLASLGREQLNDRNCYLATVKPNGAPRVHPVTPILAGEHLYVFMEPASPKGRDLESEPRYALHSNVDAEPGSLKELLVEGTAHRTGDPADRDAAIETSSYPIEERYVLFRLGVSRVLFTEYEDDVPRRRQWRDRPG